MSGSQDLQPGPHPYLFLNNKVSAQAYISRLTSNEFTLSLYATFFFNLIGKNPQLARFLLSTKTNNCSQGTMARFASYPNKTKTKIKQSTE